MNAAKVQALARVLNSRDPSLNVSEEQLERLFSVEIKTQRDLECYLQAIYYFVTTGDMLGAIAGLIGCLRSQRAESWLSVTIDCLLQFFTDLAAGTNLNEAGIDFIICVFKGIGGKIPPPPSGDLPRFNPSPVTRCG